MTSRVSILLRLDVAWEADDNHVKVGGGEVSILLRLDVAWEGRVFAQAKNGKILFQSFFGWM